MRFLVPGELRPGAHLSPASATPELQYANMDYAYDPLRQEAADRTPDKAALMVNLYAVIADHFIEETISGFDLTAVNAEDVLQVKLSVWYRALYGWGILAFVEGRLRAINPRYWWPLMSRGTRIGDVVILPYSTTSASGSLTGQNGLPDRALVAEVLTDQPASLFDADYTGITLGVNWRRINSGIQQLTVYGSGSLDFHNAKPVICEIDGILRNSTRIIDRFGHPHLQIPAALVQYDENGDPTFSISKEGSILPVQRDDKDVKYVSLAVSTDLIRHTIETLLSLLGSMVKVPPQVFNLFPLARMESGVSIEKLAQASNEKVKVWQEDLARSLLYLGLNAPRIVEETQNDTSSSASPDDADASRSAV